MAQDFLGNELNVGDDVVFMRLNYRSFAKGTIRSLTPKMAHITHEYLSGSGTESKQFHDQIVKIPNESHIIPSTSAPFTKEEVVTWLKTRPSQYGTVRVSCEDDEFNIDVFLHSTTGEVIHIAGDESEHYDISELEFIRIYEPVTNG